jgi:hypothetical protein
MPLNFNRGSKPVNPAPGGPLATPGGKRQAKGLIGMRKDKKSKAAHRAGIGHPGRQVERFTGHPHGPAGTSLVSGHSVRLPNRQKFPTGATRQSVVGSFLKRFKRGS